MKLYDFNEKPQQTARRYGVGARTITRWFRNGAPHRNLGTAKKPLYRTNAVLFDAWVAGGGYDKLPAPKVPATARAKRKRVSEKEVDLASARA
jgi:hypothetical protein